MPKFLIKHCGISAQYITEKEEIKSEESLDMIAYINEKNALYFCAPRKWSKVKHAYPDAIYIILIYQGNGTEYKPFIIKVK